MLLHPWGCISPLAACYPQFYHQSCTPTLRASVASGWACMQQAHASSAGQSQAALCRPILGGTLQVLNRPLACVHAPARSRSMCVKVSGALHFAARPSVTAACHPFLVHVPSSPQPALHPLLPALPSRLHVRFARARCHAEDRPLLGALWLLLLLALTLLHCYRACLLLRGHLHIEGMSVAAVFGTQLLSMCSE